MGPRGGEKNVMLENCRTERSGATFSQILVNKTNGPIPYPSSLPRFNLLAVAGNLAFCRVRNATRHTTSILFQSSVYLCAHFLYPIAMTLTACIVCLLHCSNFFFCELVSPDDRIRLPAFTSVARWLVSSLLLSHEFVFLSLCIGFFKHDDPYPLIPPGERTILWICLAKADAFEISKSISFLLSLK